MHGCRLNGEGTQDPLLWASNDDADLIKLTFQRLLHVFHLLLLHTCIFED
jgi:hypothetical protein